MKKRRIQKLHEIVDSPEYEGQDIHLEDDSYLHGPYDTLCYEEEGSSDIDTLSIHYIL